MTTTHGIPLDYPAAEKSANWRQHLKAPLPGSHTGSMFSTIMEDYLAFARTLPPEPQAVAILAGGFLLTTTFPSIEAAMALAVGGEKQIDILSTAPEVDYLKGNASDDVPCRPIAGLDKITLPRIPWRRSFQVARNWASPMASLASVAAPEIVAITENPVLFAHAGISNKRVGFVYAGSLLHKARSKFTSSRHDIDIVSLAGKISAFILRRLELPEDIANRLADILNSQAILLLEQSAKDMKALCVLEGLPEEVWSGSGSNYFSRAVGLEIMRRGGRVVRHDHGGLLGVMDLSVVLGLLELAPSTDFVFPTDDLAEFSRAALTKNIPAHMGKIQLRGGDGDPSIKKHILLPEFNAKNRPCVLYAPTFLRGFSKHAFSTMTDPVYLDWQLRLATAMTKMPVNLVCKPHPEGILRQPHPLSEVARTINVPFEEAMHLADIFVFDRCSSTTFWRAVCTDRPVIFIRAVPPKFNAGAAPFLEKRCTIIDVTFDQDNLPHVNYDELLDAIATATVAVDPSDMRRLLMNETGS
jgi:hypothetical protein